MIAKYPGDCYRCGRLIDKGEECDYSAPRKAIAHFNCPVSSETPEQIAERLHFVGLGEESTVKWSGLRYEIPGEQRRTA